MKGYYRDCVGRSCSEYFPYKYTALKNKKLKTAVEAYIKHAEYGYVIKTCEEKTGLFGGKSLTYKWGKGYGKDNTEERNIRVKENLQSIYEIDPTEVAKKKKLTNNMKTALTDFMKDLDGKTLNRFGFTTSFENKLGEVLPYINSWLVEKNGNKGGGIIRQHPIPRYCFSDEKYIKQGNYKGRYYNTNGTSEMFQEMLFVFGIEKKINEIEKMMLELAKTQGYNLKNPNRIHTFYGLFNSLKNEAEEYSGFDYWKLWFIYPLNFIFLDKNYDREIFIDEEIQQIHQCWKKQCNLVRVKGEEKMVSYAPNLKF